MPAGFRPDFPQGSFQNIAKTHHGEVARTDVSLGIDKHVVKAGAAPIVFLAFKKVIGKYAGIAFGPRALFLNQKKRFYIFR